MAIPNQLNVLSRKQSLHYSMQEDISVSNLVTNLSATLKGF